MSPSQRFLIRHANLLSDIANGIWSGFPICCIMKYSFHHYKGWSLDQYPFDPILHPGYVRCKRCIEEGKVVSFIRPGCLFKVFHSGRVIVLDERDLN